MTTSSPSAQAPLPTYFISHGGGPWPWMKKEMGDTYARLEAALADMPRQLGRTPKAILMVSAHWEEPAFTAMANPRPPMVPTCQNRNESNDCLLDTSRPELQLARPAVRAAPASVSRSGVTPPPASPASAWTATAAMPAPAMAHQT